MTIAWYGHLKYKDKPLVWVILISWLVALFEYAFQVSGESPGRANIFPGAAEDHAGMHHLGSFHGYGVFAFRPNAQVEQPGLACVHHRRCLFLLRVLALEEVPTFEF
jgi:uncharacterized protein (DUF486 family)